MTTGRAWTEGRWWWKERAVASKFPPALHAGGFVVAGGAVVAGGLVVAGGGVVGTATQAPADVVDSDVVVVPAGHEIRPWPRPAWPPGQ
jgi:hypothetical protein